ncbi:MAG: glycosyltransferase family 1 protein [Hyphomicrobiales bacterium]|nr:MAG: glycosyltransferase family 1 protein [Hyphomicrobiales bacterium]
MRTKVLALCEDCNPEWPSLPVVGYKYAAALSRRVDITVVTQIRNKPNIEKHGFADAKVVYLDTEHVAAGMYKLSTFLRRGNSTGWTIQMAMSYPSYLAFEFAAYKHFKQDLRAGAFDVVHRLTPMSPTLPSPMASLSDVPFVLGPLNGNLPWPAHFTQELRREREWLAHLRNAYRLLPFYRSTYAKSRAILAAFDHTVKDIAPRHQDRVINFPEVGIDPGLFSMPERPVREQQTVLFAGRLVPYKLPDVPVLAFARNPALRKHKLLIAGDGPERPMIEATIKAHDLENCVELLGQRTQAEVAALMQSADIFAFPSIRELGAGVLIEAMACGMACVCVDYGGPATLIGPDHGIKVPLGDKTSIVNSMADALGALTADPARRARLGSAAHVHALRYYAWDQKAERTLGVYDWVLGRRADKPSFWD